MVRVIPVNLPYNIKTLWFDPGDLEIHASDDVVVSTARGTEIGCAAGDIFEVEDEACKELKSPLKPVLRLATDADMERANEMDRKGREAMPIFKQLARETNEDMHPVSVEYLLDGDKAVFYFEAEERVDFRELVRKLASQFHVRVDMRQIGVRDEARIVGGIGHCGQIVCCKTMGGEFKPVSIRMAKDQDLSLNPQKISGLCGRLMCCLRYEDEAYKEFKSRAPKAGSMVHTPDGDAKVESLDIPREEVRLRIEDEKPINVPIDYFDDPEEGKRPHSIGIDGWEKAHEDHAANFMVTSEIFSTAQFTGRDKLGSANAIHHERSGASADPLAKKTPSKRKRSKSNQSHQNDSAPKRKQVKRRSTKILGSGKSEDAQENKANRSGQTKRSDKTSSQSAHKLRPGHKSSGLAHDAESKGNDGNAKKKRSSHRKQSNPSDQPKQPKNQGDAKANGSEKKSSHRRRPRKRKNNNKSDAGTSSSNQSE